MFKAVFDYLLFPWFTVNSVMELTDEVNFLNFIHKH